MRLGSLFTGIGLLDAAALAVYGPGASLAFFAERDPADERRSAWCRAVVRARHPDALDLGDVQRVNGATLPAVDVLCLGFPCQDISPAGGGAGLDGARSGLWAEVPRILGEMPPERRPDRILIENSGRLCRLGLATVLRDLAALGYDAGWQVVGAVALGAPHLRERIALVATRGGVLPVWPDFAPWRDRYLAEWWTPEREPVRVTAPLGDAAAVAHRIDAVASLGNAVCRPWAEWAATAARDAAPPPLDLFGGLDASPMPWSERLPPSGTMWCGRLYSAARVYDRGEAVARVLATPLCRMYGAMLPTPTRRDHRSGSVAEGTVEARRADGYRRLTDEAMLLPTPRASDHRSGATSEATAAKNSRPLCEVAAALLPTPNASSNGHYLGGNPTLQGLARSGALLPTPVATIATRGDCPSERARNNPHLGSVAAQLDEAGALLATPTRKGNDSRRGLSPTSGDGLATQARAMADDTRATLLTVAFVAWVLGWEPEMVPHLSEVAGASDEAVDDMRYPVGKPPRQVTVGRRRMARA